MFHQPQLHREGSHDPSFVRITQAASHLQQYLGSKKQIQLTQSLQ